MEVDIATAVKRRWVGIHGAADYIDHSVETVRRLISAGKITAYRVVRGKILIDINELDNLVLTSTSRPRRSRGQCRPTTV